MMCCNGLNHLELKSVADKSFVDLILRIIFIIAFIALMMLDLIYLYILNICVCIFYT